MDKRDPVVMQAIANVIGTQTMDVGCVSPPPGRTRAIYDEIRRLDRVRLEAEHRRAAEVEAEPKAGIDVAVLPASHGTAGPISGRSVGVTALIGDGERHEAAPLVLSAPMTSLSCSSDGLAVCSPAQSAKHHHQPVSAA